MHLFLLDSVNAECTMNGQNLLGCAAFCIRGRTLSLAHRTITYSSCTTEQLELTKVPRHVAVP